MRIRIFLTVLIFSIFNHAHAQLWSSILNPVTSACGTNSTSYSGCAIDWSSSGIPGGIPSATWTQSGSTITATGSDQSGQINTALSSCGTNHFILLATGTFIINSAIGVPSNCALRGSGANLTILQCYVTGNSCIYGGNNSGGSNDVPPCANPNCPAASVSITGGLTAGSTSITLSSTSGMSTGGYLWITQLNDPNYTSNTSSANNGGSICNCDGFTWLGVRNQGQIVEITSIASLTVGITSGGVGSSSNPGLYYPYNKTPLAVYFPAVTKYAGIEALQVYAENTGAQENFYFGSCMYCWVDGVESNYTDGNWAEIDWGFHDQISNSYMSNAFSHTSGTNDSTITIRTYTSGSLVQNNILERGHIGGAMIEWGAAGDTIAYNYIFGQYDITDFTQGSTTVVDPCTSPATCNNLSAINFHGLHPQFILIEGNVGNMFQPDNVWGSSTWATTFRNWWQGTTQLCANGNVGGLGRGTVNCTGANGYQAWQIASDYEIQAFSTRMNTIGDIIGSAQQQSLISSQGGGMLSNIQQIDAQCGVLPCGSGSRPYGSNAVGYALGFFSVGSSGGGSFDEVTPSMTILQHGVYSNITSSIQWQSPITHTLPASFYLASKPSWWASTLAFPAIGPDVIGGAGPGNMTKQTPAENCYLNIMGGSVGGGAGSPLGGFNAHTCYTTTPPPSIAAPTGLTVGTPL